MTREETQKLLQQHSEMLISLAKLTTKVDAVEEDIHEIKDHVVPRKEIDEFKKNIDEKVTANRKLSWYSLTTVIAVVLAGIGKALGVI